MGREILNRGDILKFKWRHIAEGEIEAPSKEIVQAAVLGQVSLTSNLSLSLKGIRVDAEPMELIEKPMIVFDEKIKNGR